MTIGRGFEVDSEMTVRAKELSTRWHHLCEVYLPFTSSQSIWRYSRQTEPDEPSQGWKLHISATVLQACDLFEKVAPFLVSKNLRFKAPRSLNELIKLNSGLDYGYWQVGKFLSIYPSTESEAVNVARKIHELTREFFPVDVPFDNRYLSNSSVFYRYGAFVERHLKEIDGSNVPTIENLSGELVHDNYLEPVPDWLKDPFQTHLNLEEDFSTNIATPLETTYKVFRAMTQRGKGGIYHAVDLSTNPPRLCVVKEGRRNGEVSWDGNDGYDLVKNEQLALSGIGEFYDGIPQYFSSFESEGNFYVAMEYIPGVSLADLMKSRRRRFSIKQVLDFAISIGKIIESIHSAGWIWNDCKPANLIFTKGNLLRPIDFEGAYQIFQTPPFNWKSRNFSVPQKTENSGVDDDLYAFGAVMYFMLTGKFYDHAAPISIKKLRRNVPERFIEVIEDLLSDSTLFLKPSAAEIRKYNDRIEEIQKFLT